MISERAFRMNFEEFQNQSRFYVVGALEPREVGEALPPCGSLKSALMLVRLDHVASVIINANHRIV
jgi:hypothetical protein